MLIATGRPIAPQKVATNGSTVALSGTGLPDALMAPVFMPFAGMARAAAS
jgi:hypothetical protein